MPFGIYDVDGFTRLTLAPGGSFVGAFAPDGSLYVTVAPDTGFVGAFAPDGSLYIFDATGTTPFGLRAPNGALRITYNANDNNGALKVKSNSSFQLYWGDSALVWDTNNLTWG